MIRRSAADPPATASGKRKRDKAPNSDSKRKRIARPPKSRQEETLPEPTEPISGIDNSVTDVPQKLQSWDVGEDLWHLIANFLAEPIELNWPYKSAEAYEGASNTVVQMSHRGVR